MKICNDLADAVSTGTVSFYSPSLPYSIPSMSFELNIAASQAYETLPPEHRSRMGGGIGALPGEEELPIFLEAAKRSWLDGWLNSPARYPALLLRLYHSVAFLRYDGEFWGSFAETVGEHVLSPQRQTQVNDTFARMSEHFGLRVIHGNAGRLCVKSAVWHVGIPVRVWRGFITVCERLWFAAHGWQEWPDEEWAASVAMWLGGRTNLRKFFTENREAATAWIDEMFAARLALEADHSLTLSDIQQTSPLRAEYFDQVPETALFLRPNDPESLFKDRPRLRLREDSGRVSLILEAPRVSNERHLPATWQIGGVAIGASTNPVGIEIVSEAFHSKLVLRLSRDSEVLTSHSLHGLAPWGLWSEGLGAFVSSEARELPVGGYTLVSRRPLEFPVHEGWLEDDEDERRWNVVAELSDGTRCYLSRLQPAGKRAVLEIAGSHRIIFAPRDKLELRLFPSPTNRFQLEFEPPNKVRLPSWPWFVLKIPKGLFPSSGEETETMLCDAFPIFSDEQRIPGKWLQCEDSPALEGDEFFRFKVADDAHLPTPHLFAAPSVMNNFRELGQAVLSKPKAVEPFPIQLRSKRHGVIPFGNDTTIQLTIDSAGGNGTPDLLSVSFRNYLPWFLLTATQDHATWEEIRLAFEMMNVACAGVRLNYYWFRLIELRQMMTRRGQRWTDFQNRIHFGRHETWYGQRTCVVRFAGLTTAIYPVLREIRPTENISAIREPGEPPHLQMRFALAGDTDRRLRAACQRHKIRIMHDSLWTH